MFKMHLGGCRLPQNLVQLPPRHYEPPDRSPGHPPRRPRNLHHVAGLCTVAKASGSDRNISVPIRADPVLEGDQLPIGRRRRMAGAETGHGGAEGGL